MGGEHSTRRDARARCRPCADTSEEAFGDGDQQKAEGECGHTLHHQIAPPFGIALKSDREARCPGELRVIAAWRPLEDCWWTGGDAPRLIGGLEFSKRNFGDDLTALVPEPGAADDVSARRVSGID